MKAAVYYGSRDVRIEQVPEPGPPGPDEVLIAPLAGSLCGTDVTEFVAGPKMIPLHQAHPVSGHQGPTILGHEFVGIVQAVGSHVTNLAPGQRVVPGCGMWCGSCPACQAGTTNICQRYFLYGIHGHGGLAELVKVPAKMCVPVPDNCSTEAAALGQPCAVGVHAARRSGICAGQTVAIFGMGGIGSLLLAVLLAQTKGDLCVFVVDVDARKRVLAERQGAASPLISADAATSAALRDLTGGRGVDVVIEASGARPAIAQAAASVRKGGTYLQVGIPSEPIPLALGQLVMGEISIVTTNGMVCAVDLPAALTLLADHSLATTITDRIIPLDALVAEGLEPLARHEVQGKVVIAINQA